MNAEVEEEKKKIASSPMRGAVVEHLFIMINFCCYFVSSCADENAR